jgi:hypothetical protein
MEERQMGNKNKKHRNVLDTVSDAVKEYVGNNGTKNNEQVEQMEQEMENVEIGGTATEIVREVKATEVVDTEVAKELTAQQKQELVVKELTGQLKQIVVKLNEEKGKLEVKATSEVKKKTLGNIDYIWNRLQETLNFDLIVKELMDVKEEYKTRQYGDKILLKQVKDIYTGLVDKELRYVQHDNKEWTVDSETKLIREKTQMEKEIEKTIMSVL